MNQATLVFHDKPTLVKHYITGTDKVLDVGFWGQGIKVDDTNWIHELLYAQAGVVYGTDIEYDEKSPHIQANPMHYLQANAEQFNFEGQSFDSIIASELIEHLSNPGMFLDRCKKHLNRDGLLIITTPNCFNLFNIAGKISRVEPVTNADHTCYYNSTTLKCLLEKNGWTAREVAYVYTLNIKFQESVKKKILNIVYKLCSIVTPKFLETLVIVAEPTRTEK